MEKVIHITEIITAFQDANFLWLLIPIFFAGIITDKYQEEFGTSIGDALSNGTMIIFTGFSWMEIISSRISFDLSIQMSQYLLTWIIIAYGFLIIASGFGTGRFARKYGRVRVITFMLLFITIMIYIPLLYNFVSVVLFVLLFPFYYAFITELVKVLPSATDSVKVAEDLRYEQQHAHDKLEAFKMKIREYLE